MHNVAIPTQDLQSSLSSQLQLTLIQRSTIDQQRQSLESIEAQLQVAQKRTQTLEVENERYDTKVKEFRQKMSLLAQKVKLQDNQRLQDSERVEASERVLIEERGALQDRAEQLEKRCQEAEQVLKSERTRNNHLQKEVKQSFMVQFKDKVAEIGSSSAKVLEMQKAATGWAQERLKLLHEIRQLRERAKNTESD